MAVTRNQFTEGMQKDAYKYYFESYDALPTVYDKIFEVTQSDSAFEKSTTAIRAGQPREKKVGDKILISNPMEGYTVYVKNRTFADGIEFTMEMTEDMSPTKIANVVQEVARGWGEGVIAAKETYAAKLFNYGGYTAGNDVFNGTITGVVDDPTGDLCYDGKPFFALSGNNHPAKSGSTYYNSLALALSSTNLQTAYNLMTVTNAYNERGEKVSIRPDTLLIPPNLRFTAKTILESDNIVSSANNDINVTKGIVTPIEWPYLTDTDAWFLGKAKTGLVWLERKEPVIDSYIDDSTKNTYVTIVARWGAGMTNWRYWVGSQLSTS